MKTDIYVHGFNLYDGCVNGIPWRWLDLSALAHRLCPNDAFVTSLPESGPLLPMPRNPSVKRPF